MNNLQQEWYWVISLFLLFLQRDAILEICFALIEMITTK